MKAIHDRLGRDLKGSRTKTKETEILLSCQQYFNQRIEFKPAIHQDTYFEQLKKKYKPLNKGFKKAIKAKMTDQSKSRANDPAHTDIPAPRQVIFDPNRIQLGWAEIKGIGGGLGNMGNTCFLNSVLQCLTYTPPLVNYLYSGEHKKSCNIQGFCAMCELNRHITRTFSSRGKTIRPVTIVQNLNFIAKHFRPGRQEDSHEFLRYFVEALQKACLHGYPSKLDPYSKYTTVIHQIFGGYHRSAVQCLECNKTSNTFDPLLDVSLDIKGCSSIHRALERSTKPDLLDEENRYACPFCKKLTKAQKMLTVHRPPNILTIHLKRFDYNSMFGLKINKHIEYKERLNIRPYMSDKEGPPVWYSLYAVLVHLGMSCHSGHYFCFIKNSNNTWFSLNDAQVQNVSQNTVLNQEAYLLFYKKDNSRSPKNNDAMQQTKASSMNNLVVSKFPKPTGIVNPSIKGPPPPPPPPLSPQATPTLAPINRVIYTGGHNSSNIPPPPPPVTAPTSAAPPPPPTPPPTIDQPSESTTPVSIAPPTTTPTAANPSSNEETFELRKSDGPVKAPPTVTPTVSTTDDHARPKSPVAVKPVFMPRSVSFVKKTAKPVPSKPSTTITAEGKHPPVAMVSPQPHMKPVARVPPSPQMKLPLQTNNEDQASQKFKGSGKPSGNMDISSNNLNERESPVSFGPTLPPDSAHKGLGERSEKVTVVFKRNIGKTKNISATMSETESDDKSEPNEPPVYEVRNSDRKKKKHRKHSRQDDEKRRGHKRKHRHREDTPSQSDFSEEERRYKRRKDTRHKRKGKHRSPSPSSDSDTDYSSGEYEYKRSHDTSSRSHDTSSRSHDSKGHRKRSSGGTMEQDKSHNVPEMYWEATKKGGYRTKNSEKTSQIGLSDLLEGRHGDVQTWDGEKSSLDVREKETGSRRRGRDDWDEDYDRGKAKKIKKQQDGGHHREKGNPFQQHYKNKIARKDYPRHIRHSKAK